MNPGPHGPESHEVRSSRVDFGQFQFETSSLGRTFVQICADLQLDYYMICYRLGVIVTDRRCPVLLS